MMTCLENIVGIAAANCACLTDGLPDDVKTKLHISTSGLFLEDLEGLPQLRAAQNLESCKSMAQLALDARDEAIKRTGDDLMLAINTLYTKAKASYLGSIGQLTFAMNLAANLPLQGQKLSASGATDAILTINRMQVLISGIENTNVLIIKAYRGAAMGEILFTLPVTTNAGEYSPVVLPNSKPILLPLSEMGQPIDYYILYDRGASNPKDNKIACLPCQQGSSNSLAAFLNVSGVQVTDVNSLNAATTDIYARGIILDVDIRCNNQNFICREYSREEVIAIALSYTVRYKTGELFIEKIMASGEINRYTTMNREFLWGKRNSYKKEYKDRIDWLAKTVDTSTSDCFTCNKKNTGFYSGIMS